MVRVSVSFGGREPLPAAGRVSGGRDFSRRRGFSCTTSPSATRSQPAPARPTMAYSPSRCGWRPSMTKNWLEPVSRPPSAMPTTAGFERRGRRFAAERRALGSAVAVAARIAELHDEARDDAMHGDAVEKARAREIGEARCGNGRERRVEHELERSSVGVEDELLRRSQKVSELAGRCVVGFEGVAAPVALSEAREGFFGVLSGAQGAGSCNRARGDLSRRGARARRQRPRAQSEPRCPALSTRYRAPSSSA